MDPAATCSPFTVGHVKCYPSHVRPDTFECRWKIGSTTHRQSIKGLDQVKALIARVNDSFDQLVQPLTASQMADVHSALHLLRSRTNPPSFTELAQHWLSSPPPPPVVYLYEAEERYRQDRLAKGVARATNTGHLLYRLVGWVGVDTPLKDVTKEDLLALVPEELAPDTRRTRIQDFRAFFGWCHLQGWVSSPTPADLLVLPKKPRKDPLPLKATELRKFLAFLRDNPPILHLVCFLAFTGVRVSEALRLRIDHVVRGQDGETFLTLPASVTKTHRRRVIRIPDNLKTWRSHFPAPRPGQTLMFDDPQLVDKLTKAWSRFLAQGDKSVTKRPRNGLRKGWISYRVAQGDSLADIAREAGHSESILESTYKGLVVPDNWFLYPTDL